MKIHMPWTNRLGAAVATAAVTVSSLLVAVAPVQAAQGDVLGVSFRDLDHNGRIERAIITVANPSHQTLAVTNVSSLAVTYGGKALTPIAAYVADSSDPATLVVVWNQDDANLPIDTSASQFAVSWPQFGVTKDAKAIDQASPVLVSSIPAAGTLGAAVNQPVILTFSEPIVPSTFMWQSQSDVSGWATTWSSDARTVTMTHASYGFSVPVTFTVTKASDAAGNAIVPGALSLNPFHFTNYSSSLVAPAAVDTVFAINEPTNGSSVIAGQPTVISWYSNQPLVTQVRLSWSVNGGTTYLPLAVFPIGKGSAVWYPSGNAPTSFILKLEGLTSAGAVSAIDVHNMMLAAGSGVVPFGDEQTLPALATVIVPPTGSTTMPAPASDVTAPMLVGNAVVDSFDPKTKTATLHFSTNEPTSVTVYYGVRKNYAKIATDGMSATDHVITLKGLTVSAMHNLRINMADAAGNGAASKDVFFQFLKEGDRIKGTGPGIYWYKGGTKQLFPTPKLYLSHFRSWSGIITIGDTQLNNLSDGPAVTK